MKDDHEYLEDFAGLGEWENDPLFEDFEEEVFEDWKEAKDEFAEFEEPKSYEAKYQASDIAEMEALAEAIMATQSEAESDAFLGAIASVASKILPKAISIGKKVLPGLIRGARAVVNKVQSSPTGQQVIRSLPTLMRNTASEVLQRVSQGQPVSGQYVVRSLAGQASRLLRDPTRRSQIVHNHGRWVRRMHEVCQRPYPRSCCRPTCCRR